MAREWDVTRRTVGTLSIWIGTAALFAPRALPRLLGGAVSALLTVPASVAALGLDGVVGPLGSPGAGAFTAATVSDLVASVVTLPFLAVVLVLAAGRRLVPTPQGQ